MPQHSFQRAYIGIKFSRIFQYILFQIVLPLDFAVKRSFDPTLYLLQFSLLVTWGAVISDLMKMNGLETMTWLAIVSQLFVAAVVGTIVGGYEWNKPKTYSDSVQEYNKRSVDHFDSVEGEGKKKDINEEELSLILKRKYRYPLLVVALGLAILRVYTLQIYYHGSWWTIIALVLSYTEFVSQYLQGIFFFNKRNIIFTDFILDDQFCFENIIVTSENVEKTLLARANDVYACVDIRYFLNTYRPMEWFILNITTYSAGMTMLAEIIYIIFFFAFKNSHGVCWFFIITDFAIAVTFFFVIKTISYQYDYHLDIVKRRLVNFNQLLNISLNKTEESKELTAFFMNLRFSDFSERDGAPEALGIYNVKILLPYIVQQILPILILVAVVVPLEIQTNTR